MVRAAEAVPAVEPTGGVVMDAELRRKFEDLLRSSEAFFKEVQGLISKGRSLDLRKEARVNSEIARQVTSKWSVEIIFLLYMGGPMGFEELRRTLGRISSRTLSQRLQTLERLGYLERKLFMARPIRVRYSLTEKGRSVATVGSGLFLYLRYVEGHLGGR
ncbi:MAG: helix-turn-helix transcriptional regulator [Euryarchaeota archaeon]|nr:helix-turn-helix transcriptional regulator [Euryarchaeota archaeon]